MIRASPPNSARSTCVPSERVQRQIDRLLDEADQAMARLDWQMVRERALAVLTADPENADGKDYLAMAERGSPATASSSAESSLNEGKTSQPVSFANGRYTVTRFLG